MTNQEAIKELRERYELGKKEYNEQIPEYVEALRMAIEALEQIATIQELNGKILDSKISYEQLNLEHELSELVNGTI